MMGFVVVVVVAELVHYFRLLLALGLLEVVVSGAVWLLQTILRKWMT